MFITQINISLIGSLIKHWQKNLCPAQIGRFYIAEWDMYHVTFYEFVNSVLRTDRFASLRYSQIHITTPNNASIIKILVFIKINHLSCLIDQNYQDC